MWQNNSSDFCVVRLLRGGGQGTIQQYWCVGGRSWFYHCLLWNIYWPAVSYVQFIKGHSTLTWSCDLFVRILATSCHILHLMTTPKRLVYYFFFRTVFQQRKAFNFSFSKTKDTWESSSKDLTGSPTTTDVFDQSATLCLFKMMQSSPELLHRNTDKIFDS